MSEDWLKKPRGRPPINAEAQDSRVTVRLPGYLCTYLQAITANVSVYIRFLIEQDASEGEDT